MSEKENPSKDSKEDKKSDKGVPRICSSSAKHPDVSDVVTCPVKRNKEKALVIDDEEAIRPPKCTQQENSCPIDAKPKKVKSKEYLCKPTSDKHDPCGPKKEDPDQ